MYVVVDNGVTNLELAMATLIEFFEAVKELRELREELKSKESEVKALGDGLSSEDRELLGSTTGLVGGEVRTRRKLQEYKEKIRQVLRNKGGKALTSKELRAKTGFDANQINNTLWQMRDELEKVAANDKRLISPQNMAYRLKSPNAPKK